MGYYHQPELDATVLDKDGWLHTGDLAQIDDQGFVFITGRKKDVIITAGGKNVSPAPLEDVISTCPIVSQAVVVGDGRPFVGALVTLDAGMLKSWLTSQGLDADMSLEQASHNDAIHAFIQQYVDKANCNVSRAESVRKFLVLDKDFSQEDGTLTPSLKVVRPEVLRQYAELVDKVLYAPRTPAKPAAKESDLVSRARTTMSDSLASMTGRKRDGRQEEVASEDEKDGRDGRNDEE